MLDDWNMRMSQEREIPCLLRQAFCDAIGNDRLRLEQLGRDCSNILNSRSDSLKFEERRAELLKPNAQRKARARRPRKS